MGGPFDQEPTGALARGTPVPVPGLADVTTFEYLPAHANWLEDKEPLQLRGSCSPVGGEETLLTDVGSVSE